MYNHSQHLIQSDTRKLSQDILETVNTSSNSTGQDPLDFESLRHLSLSLLKSVPFVPAQTVFTF